MCENSSKPAPQPPAFLFARKSVLCIFITHRSAQGQARARTPRNQAWTQPYVMCVSSPVAEGWPEPPTGRGPGGSQAALPGLPPSSHLRSHLPRVRGWMACQSSPGTAIIQFLVSFCYCVNYRVDAWTPPFSAWTSSTWTSECVLLFSAFRLPHKVQSLPWGLSSSGPSPEAPHRSLHRGGGRQGVTDLSFGVSHLFH